MTREEAKKVLPFISALAEGRQIQTLDVNSGDWEDIDEITVDYFISHHLDYRIKPEPTYRPFYNGDECWTEMDKHEPFGWVKIKNDPTNATVGIAEVNDTYMFLSGSYSNESIDYADAFKNLTFIDDTPFGMKEERL